jgi:putative SOS response-associated peptidase YedK
MCGRYGRRGDKQKIAEAFHVKTNMEEVDFEEDDDAAPGSIQPVVMANRDGERALENMRWGFKTPKALLFNTRSDSAATSNFWKKRFEDKRCIIPASSFFEWQGDKGRKTKYEVVVPHQKYFGMAGVWAPWKNPKTDKWENTFSIFTSDPNGVMVPIHDRQPVILEPNEYEEWLAQSERPPVHLLRVFPDEKMKMMPVAGGAVEAVKTKVKKPAIKSLFD